MKNTKRQKSAFGTSAPRFSAIGQHPNLYNFDPRNVANPKLGPGEYDFKGFKCKYKEDRKESTWTRMVELAEFSKYLGFRNAPILEERAFQKIHRGPGCYNVVDDGKKSHSIFEDKGFGTEPRFYSALKNDNPSAGNYFRDIFAPYPNTSKSFTLRKSTFERDGFVDRFKSTEPNYRLPCNRYNVVDGGSLEALANRVVSLKGPYNLFTGKRDRSSIKNHFGEPHTTVPIWYHVEPSDIDRLLHHPSKRRCGKFFQEERFPKKATARMLISDLTMCYRDPKEPGPGEYNFAHWYSVGMSKIKRNRHGFNSSVVYPRPAFDWTIHPGPGRYYIKHKRCDKKHRPSWVFKSTIERKFFPKPPVYSDEY